MFVAYCGLVSLNSDVVQTPASEHRVQVACLVSGAVTHLLLLCSRIGPSAHCRAPRLLICDEATSALDTATEQGIMGSLDVSFPSTI